MTLKPEHHRAFKLMGSALYALGDFEGAKAALKSSLACVWWPAVHLMWPGTQQLAWRECGRMEITWTVSCSKVPHLSEGPQSLTPAELRSLALSWSQRRVALPLPPLPLQAEHRLRPCSHVLLGAAPLPAHCSCRLKADYADAHCDLGCTYCAQGDVDNAKKCFKAAISVNPAHLETHFNMGNLLRQCAEFERAIRRCGLTQG